MNYRPEPCTQRLPCSAAVSLIFVRRKLPSAHAIVYRVLSTDHTVFEKWFSDVFVHHAFRFSALSISNIHFYPPRFFTVCLILLVQLVLMYLCCLVVLFSYRSSHFMSWSAVFSTILRMLLHVSRLTGIVADWVLQPARTSFSWVSQLKLCE